MALRAATLVAALALLAAAGTAPEPCRIIVHPSNPATQIQRAALVAIYLGQMTRWGDGKPIAPVDQSTQSIVRTAFSQKILGRSVQAVQHHWLRKMASDQSRPPPVKPSDAEVAAYVRARPGAIGYVTHDFALDETIRELRVVEARSPGGVE